MKIKPEHYLYMKEAVQKVMYPGMFEEYIRRGLSEKRYRWDLLYMANLSSWICDNLYPYLDDSHIDTALKNIIIDK